VPLGNSPDFKFVDHAAGWQARYQYRITPVTIVPGGLGATQIEGDDSRPVEILVNDIYPPSIPSGLQAVFSGIGQQPFVDLTWAPVTAGDLAGYNVYRREASGPAVKLNIEPVKTPAFRDAQVQPGKTYVYSVSAEDVRKNESDRSEETSESVP
jgi:fibronectin type 3 domain-containing protein